MEMKDAKIELKNVKTFHGREGIGLDADLVINGKKVAHVLDDARGGMVDFDPYGKDHDEIKANRKILSELEEYVKTLPQKQWPAEFGGGMYDQDLESFVNDLLAEVEKAKTWKKMQKKFDTHIIAGVPNGETYREWSYGKGANKLPLAQVSARSGREKLQNDINTIKASLPVGERILNTNLAALGIQI